MNRKGSLTLVVVLITLVVTLSTVVYISSGSDSLSGAAVSGEGVEGSTVVGSCNISIVDSLYNLGHDYECDTDGFHIDADDVTLDCGNHTISCVGPGDCNNLADSTTSVGIRITNRSGVTIQNCKIYNFTVGIKIDRDADTDTNSRIVLRNNLLSNNSWGISVENTTLSNFTGNTINGSNTCGFNLSASNIGSTTNYNNIWNNIFWNNTNNACSSPTDKSYWYLSPNCQQENIIGGPCLGGNFWDDYSGFDSTGDGLGDTLVPHKAGGILAADPFGDNYPLVDPAGVCPIVYSVSIDLKEDFVSNVSSGECMALVGNNMTLDCKGYSLIGAGTLGEDERGIEIANQHNITIKNCQIYNFTYGVHIANSDNITLENNSIYNNFVAGVYLTQTERSNISGNTIFRNSTDGVMNQTFGVWLQSAKPASPTGDNTIISNTIYNMTQYGIYLSDSSDGNTITSNNVFNNTHGIYINQSDANVITNNEMHNNSNAGLFCNASSLGNFGSGTSRNRAQSNDWGYWLQGCTAPTLGLTGEILNNTNGIMFNEAPQGTDHYIGKTGATLIFNNTNVGINITRSYNVYIEGVNISGHSQFGLFAYATRNLTVADEGNVRIYNNTFGVVLDSANESTFDASFGTQIRIHNNSNTNILVQNSRHNTFDSLVVYGGTTGLNSTGSNHSTYINSNFSYFTNYNLYFNQSFNNTIYNNYLNNESTSVNSIDAYDDGNNTWNRSRILGTNIVGGQFLGGNYFTNFKGNDTTGDGISDDQTEYNITNTSLAHSINTDFLPLVIPGLACGNFSSSINAIQNLSASGTCMHILADNITIDLGGYWLIGNGSGIGINISGRSGVKIINANIVNFSIAIYVDPSSDINISSINFSDSATAINFLDTNHSFVENNFFWNNTYAINLTNSYNNTIMRNNITNNTIGLALSASAMNLIYNNHFNNTNNSYDNGSTNNWNTSYNGSLPSFLGSTGTGGNFWSNYLGTDSGTALFPYNTSNDGVGDTLTPYTNNDAITGGDYFPMTANNGVATITCQSVGADTVLNGDVTCSGGNGVLITSDSITLDCNGYVINGDGTGSGISLEGRQNVIIKDCNVANFSYGIELVETRNIQIIEDNDLRENNFYGIYLFQANNTIIDSNQIIDDNNGVYALNSYNTTINNNTINLQKKFYGIYLFNSDVNVIANNTMWDNYHGIYMINSSSTNVSHTNISSSDVYNLFLHKGTTTSYFSHNLFTLGQEGIRIRQNSNTNNLTNNSITHNRDYGVYIANSQGNGFRQSLLSNNTANVYLTNASSTSYNNNTVIFSETGFQVVSGSTSASFENNTVNSSSVASLVINSSSSANIHGNTFYNDLHLNTANSASLENNVVYNSTIIDNSDGITIRNNNTIFTRLNITNSDTVRVDDNNLNFVKLETATTSDITNNTFTQLLAISVSSSNISLNVIANSNYTVLDLKSTTSSDIRANNIQNSTRAIHLYSSSNSNSIYDNWIKDNGFGFNITSSTSNTIYNNYFENTNNVYDSSGNTWYSTYHCGVQNIVGGPCKGGNFYSDYYGLDNGASSREQGDGIGDQPVSYTIATGNTDTLPLVLFVARQYFAPTDTTTLAMTATANSSGVLANEEVVPNEVQKITYSSGGIDYVELTAFLNQSDVHAETLDIEFDNNRTYVNVSGITGFADNYSIFVHPVLPNFDNGVFLCPQATQVSHVNLTCPGLTNISPGYPTVDTGYGVAVQSDGFAYKLFLTNTTMGAGLLPVQGSVCALDLEHNITLTANITCDDTALTIHNDQITLDCAGYNITYGAAGNANHYGVNNSGGFDNFTVKNCVINEETATGGGKYAIQFDSGVGEGLIFNNTITTLGSSSFGVHLLSTNTTNVSSNKVVSQSYGIFSYTDTNLNTYELNSINSTGNYALLIHNRANNHTVKDNTIFGLGTSTLTVDVLGGDYNTIKGNSIYFNGSAAGAGIILDGPNNNQTEISFNTISMGASLADGIEVKDYTYFTNISYNNISHSNASGIYISESNESFIFGNRLVNNSVGINLSLSWNNTIYNNFLNNTDNAFDNSTNFNFWNVTYNCSGTQNILGDPCMGGNFWHDNDGWDTDADGVSDNLLPYNNSDRINGTAGDYLPIVPVGYISCANVTQNVTTNISLIESIQANSTCLTIGAADVTINCTGRTITYGVGESAGYGIWNDGFGNVTIENCVLVEGNTTGNDKDAIYFQSAINGSITNSTITVTGTNSNALALIASNSTAVSLATIMASDYAVNVATDASFNSITHSTINTSHQYSVLLNVRTDGNTIENNTIHARGDAGGGIYLQGPMSNNVLQNNRMTVNGSGNPGILLNTIVNSTNIFNNIINTSGALADGIHIAAISWLNNITGNNISNTTGNAIWLEDSDNNSITGNTLLNNSIGINISAAGNTSIFNNYLENTINAYDNASHANYWNITYNCSNGQNILGQACMGGNFWSDYNGSDNGSGYSTNHPWNVSGDGIGDNLIPANSTFNVTGPGDLLPLVSNASSSSSSSSSGSGSSSTGSGGSGSSSSGGSSGGSTSSSSGGSSSSSSGGRSVTATASCTQSWECSAWQECISGTQTRNCNDVNNCNAKQTAGQIRDVVAKTKPTETQTCVSPAQPPAPAEPIQTPPPAQRQPILPAAVTQPGPVRAIAISSIAFLSLFGGLAAFWEFGYRPNRLRRKLRKLSPLLQAESADVLRDNYLSVYNLYMKLSEGHKKNFYPKITGLRERIEGQMKAEKKVEELFKKAMDGDVKQRRKTYLEIFKNYEKLPSKAQERYYHRIVQLRQYLEGSRK